jgi:hypothetical protein
VSAGSTKSQRYQPPELNGHKVAYKGMRFWVIEIEEDRPFEWLSKDIADYAIYDKREQDILACALRDQPDGFICTVSLGQITHEKHVDDIRELGVFANREILPMMKWYL